jgi:hypothetical protein
LLFVCCGYGGWLFVGRPFGGHLFVVCCLLAWLLAVGSWLIVTAIVGQEVVVGWCFLFCGCLLHGCGLLLVVDLG